ncbi:MAG: hypothetical protein IJ862_00235 [Selenomonadaceae bacterium]|nr:hypothetical protein [Selenomonadaceae bacterium]
MELWQVTSANSMQVVSSSSRDKPSNSVKSDYAKILAEKLATAKNDMEQMNKMQEELDFNRRLHEELTGTRQDGNSAVSSVESTETIKRIMPDGSIRFLKIQDGEIVEQFVKKPHLIAVADPTAPPTASGNTAVTMKPHEDLFSLLF